MARFWERRRGFDLERELRAARPEPRPEFIQAVSERVEERRKSYRGLRVSFATAVVLGLLVAVASVGGIGYAASGVSEFVKSATAIVKPTKPRVVEKTSAADQYPSARAKVCHRGRVISVPASTLRGHLRHGDTRVSNSARTGAKCVFRARAQRRGAPAFTG